MIALATLALTLAAGPALSSPAGDPALRARLEPLLGAIDRPVTPDDWRRLPPGALALLEAIAADPAEFPTRRATALEGAAALGSDGALHRRMAEDPQAPFVVRLRALRALPAIARGSVAAVALPLLQGDPDSRIRSAAAEVLAGTEGGGPCAAVRAQARREDEAARFAFERALRRCAGR